MQVIYNGQYDQNENLIPGLIYEATSFIDKGFCSYYTLKGYGTQRFNSLGFERPQDVEVTFSIITGSFLELLLSGLGENPSEFTCPSIDVRRFIQLCKGDYYVTINHI